jgi:prevent-host-death family protein
MIQVNLKEAEAHLAELITEAATGREVVITSAGFNVRLVLLPRAHHELPDLAGAWSAEQEAELLHAVEFFEEIAGTAWA